VMPVKIIHIAVEIPQAVHWEGDFEDYDINFKFGTGSGLVEVVNNYTTVYINRVFRLQLWRFWGWGF
jgi:hypothetical protein